MADSSIQNNMLLLGFCFVLLFNTASSKCFDTKESQPKYYLRYEGLSLNLSIQTTSRVTHQMTSHIFKILLEDVLDYGNVQVVEIEDDFSATKVIDVLTGNFTPEHIKSIPRAMINLEVWVPSHMDTIRQLQLENVIDCGMLRPPGRFSWFIPKSLITPIIDFDPEWSHELGDVPWTFFKSNQFASAFHIYNKSALLGITELSMDKCHQEEACAYIPSKCAEKNCATLLAPMNQNTDFLKEQIDEYELYVEVVWLGKHFKQATRKVQNSLKTNGTQSVLMMAWTPSDLIYPEGDFVSVIFNKCKYTASFQEECMLYESTKLEKFAWAKLEIYAKNVYEAIRDMRFDAQSYDQMMIIHNQYSDRESYEEMACRWMKSSNIWENWHKKSEKKTLYIAGIFPLNNSSYRGSSIFKSMRLAASHINNNSTILNDYTLKYYANDGQCNAEQVMRSFIRYVDDSKIEQIVGVLGPACSDTVEPLAGVSKNFKMIIISYSAEGASFSDREKYPYFFRTIGSNSEFRFVYLELLKQLGWKRAAALTEDGQKYTEYISYTQNLLESNGITFIANSKFPRLKKGIAINKYLEDLKNKSATIIIADVFEEVARSVMCEAHHLQMTMAHGYVWFLPAWLNSNWYDTDLFNKKYNESVRCPTETMIKAIDGYFSLSHAFWGPDDSFTIANQTVKEWKKKYSKDIGDGKSSQVSDYAGFAYDAVWTYALALDKLVQTDPDAVTELHSDKTTMKLVNFIENSDFNGVSGRIHFRGGSSRYSIIHVNQWTERNNWTTVGRFYPNVTDTSPEILGGRLQLNETAISWSRNGRPKDRTPLPVCSLDMLSRAFNVNCEMAIVILCMMIFGVCLAAIGIWIILYRKQVETRIKRTQKVIEALGLDPQKAVSELDKWETPREHVVINRKLGEGAFGTVYGGEVYIPNTGWAAVAVKTLKRGSTLEEKVDFLSEAETMKKFEHKNIIKLIGVCIKDEPVYTIMEFMLYGDLKTYLLARRNLVSQKGSEEHDDVSSKRLTSMALDVARGLSYLAEKKYVHRDVACRNCLVNSNKVVKLGDFGMTRAMYENDYYKFTRKGMLPVRWMAPESLALGVFTPASDVWSYGVLLYETITFGSFPFQGLSNSQVLEHVKEGNTLNVPKGVKPQLEIFLKSCWNENPKKRPCASETVDFLANNPHLISPSLDGPTAAVAIEGSDEFEVHIPQELRQWPPTVSTFMNNTFSQPNSAEAPLIDFTDKSQRDSAPDSGVSIQFDYYCPREPLLAGMEKSSSLKGLGYVAVNQNHSSPNLCTGGEQERQPNGFFFSKR